MFISIHIHTHNHLSMHVCIYVPISIYVCMCVCEYVLSPLIDEAIFQVIKSKRIYSTRTAVATTERSYGEQTTMMLRTRKTLIHS